MKKLFCLLLALALCPLCAQADDSAAAVLTYEELTVWADACIQRAREGSPLNDPADSLTADGYEYIYDFATLYADSPVLSDDTEFGAVVLTGDGETDPRGLRVGDALEAVLSAYYSENETLTGSRESAVLYVADALPESARWALVSRDGQRVTTVQYAVHEQLSSGGDGYSDAGVIYTMAENRVSAVRVYGLNSRIGLDAVNDVVYSVMLADLADNYAQVPFSYVGSELLPLSEADMTFSGLSFLTMTAEEADTALGGAMEDIWVENGDEGWIRVQTYADCQLTWLYDVSRTSGQIYMLEITADGLEGPRAVRIGDTFSSVYNRIRNGEGEYQEDGTEVLYGAEGDGAFGVADYGYDASATLRYGFPLADGRTVTLRLDFAVMELADICLYVD